MKRTRKWEFVKQEASRLAGLGLSPKDIADRLEVNKSTVTRWIRAGKLNLRTEAGPATVPNGEAATNGARQSPEQWAATVRADYALDATDDQLVTMAEAALGKALDELVGLNVRLQAMGRFQAIVRQLALVARRADQPVPTSTEEPKTHAVARVPSRRPAIDPRKILTAVK